MLKNGANLLQGNARKPLNEVGDLRAVFKVLKERRDGHARTPEHPRAADAAWVPFNGGTGIPSINGRSQAGRREAGNESG